MGRGCKGAGEKSSSKGLGYFLIKGEKISIFFHMK